MKHIEIVFDNSGSMSAPLANSTRAELAKTIFKNQIIPQLIGAGYKIFFRMLSPNCDDNIIHCKELTANKNELEQFINNLPEPTGNTPLYKAISEAIFSAQSSNATEKTIFIITDGFENCHGSIDDLKSLNIDYKNLLNFILVQYADESNFNTLQINSLGNHLGAKIFKIGGDETTSLNEIENAFSNIIQEVVIGNNLNPCYQNTLFGEQKTWDEIEFKGILKYQARILFIEGFLSFNPDDKIQLIAAEQAELNFLYTLRFRNCLPAEIMRNMLAQLKKPFYYSLDCINWDFQKSKWIKITKAPENHPLDIEDIINNDDVREALETNGYRIFSEEELEDYVQDKIPENKQYYYPEEKYVVKKQTDSTLFGVETKFFIDKDNPDKKDANQMETSEVPKRKNKVYMLEEGDIVRFIK